MKFYDNSLHVKKDNYTHQNILSLKNFEKAKKEISSWVDYMPTRIHSLDDIAKENDVSKVLCFGTKGDTDELMYKKLINSKIRID